MAIDCTDLLTVSSHKAFGTSLGVELAGAAPPADWPPGCRVSIDGEMRASTGLRKEDQRSPPGVTGRRHAHPAHLGTAIPKARRFFLPVGEREGPAGSITARGTGAGLVMSKNSAGVGTRTTTSLMRPRIVELEVRPSGEPRLRRNSGASRPLRLLPDLQQTKRGSHNSQ